MDVVLLGPLSIEEDGTAIELSGPKRRSLLILLALHAGTPLTRDRIIDALWPARTTGKEESTLRVHISHLRDVLEPDRSSPPSVILTEGSSYMLAAEAISLDVNRFRQLAEDGRSALETDPERAVDLLNEALELWRGRPLQDVEYEEYAQEHIRSLESTRLEAIEDRADALIRLGEDGSAVGDLEAQVRAHPTRERPVLLLMRALYRTGRHAESLRVARRHSRELGEQGLEPSPMLAELEGRILGHDPTLLPEGTMAAGDIRPGRSIRGYELREEAGAGSVGVVFRAFQPAVGREVAIKVIDPTLADAPAFLRRFTEEARVVAGLEHPHIVPLYDFWRDSAGAFLVMRWLDGGSMADRLDRPWRPADLARVFAQLADALGYAHSAGIVHRDVRPGNVLFDESGNAYVCDFGLAAVGLETGRAGPAAGVTLQQPYGAPEAIRHETASVAADIYSLGMLLAEAAAGSSYTRAAAPLDDRINEVVTVATAANPADRYPDMAAFRAALLDAVGEMDTPTPRSVRRNPYKGLAAFDEGDETDFYGREDAVESLLDLVAANGLAVVIGASGSGKSSLVMAGLLPRLRGGGLPGSDEWAVVTMVPGVDPFEEFHLGLREAAVADPAGVTEGGPRELRAAFDRALDGPVARAVLVIDQFEEVFSSEVDDDVRERFLDNIVDLSTDPSSRFRIVATLRADFSDRPLAHQRLGDLIAKATMLVAPMRPDQVEEAIRNPAARVGVQTEPGLVSEIVRDISSAPAALPLLQYVLTEAFERRTEDRLTVSSYRALGGIQGVLERRAEATYADLDSSSKRAARQLFLRMIHLGDHGEETRRRLPLTELRGLEGREAVDRALEAFASARLLTYDRDPVTRTPTVEVAHETVIRRWTRYRVWIDEARADLRAHRRLASAAATWTATDEDPTYLLTGGPLAAAFDMAQNERVDLNEREARFLAESRLADEAARAEERARVRRETELGERARRRLLIGSGAAVVALVVAAFATIAWVQRQRANDLAAAQERQSTARSLAAASLNALDSSDPDLSLLLAVEAADLSLDVGEDVLPEVVDALHRAVINPRPTLIIDGARAARGGNSIALSPDGSLIAMMTEAGGAAVADRSTGQILGETPPAESQPFGIDLHPAGTRILTVHRDGVRQWDWRSGDLESELLAPAPVRSAVYSRDGSLIAMGCDDGVIRVWDTETREMALELTGGHEGVVMSVDFDPSGTRLVSGGADTEVLIWDLGTGEVSVRADSRTIVLGIEHLVWHPNDDIIAVASLQGDSYLLNGSTGERLNSFGFAESTNRSIAFDPSGAFTIAADGSGSARLYGTYVGGAAAITLPNGGVPLRDAEMTIGFGAVTVGVDGRIRVWNDLTRSELPARLSISLYPLMGSSANGSRYFFGSHLNWLGVPDEVPASLQVIDAASQEVLAVRPLLKAWAGWGHPAISADGKLVAYAGVTGEVEITEVDRGTTTVLADSKDWSVDLDFSPDGSLLAGAGPTGVVRIWDLRSQTLALELRGHGDRKPRNGSEDDGRQRFSEAAEYRVDSVKFSPDGSKLATGGFDGTVRIWDSESGAGTVLHEFPYEVFGLIWSPDGRAVVAGDRTGTLEMIDVESGEVILEPDPLSSGMLSAAFSADGKLMAAAGGGPLVSLWDMETGRRIRTIRGATFDPGGVVFVNGDSELRVASGEGIDRGYLLDPAALTELARGETTRTLTADECRQYLSAPCRQRNETS